MNWHTISMFVVVSALMASAFCEFVTKDEKQRNRFFLWAIFWAVVGK